MELVLPWPPSLNRIWRAVNSRILLSADARAYHKQVHNALVGLPVKPLAGRLHFRMDLFPPHKLAGKVWDLGNREKIVADALTKQRIWLDDSQVDEQHIVRGPAIDIHPNGLAVVTISWRE